MKRFITYIASALVLISAGCKKGYLDVNDNPNDAVSSTPDLVLPNGLVRTAAILDNPLGTFSYVSGWMGYIAISGSYAISNNDFTTYRQTSAFGENAWQNFYHNLADYDYVVKNSTGFYKGVATVMKSLDFQYLVDLFNNVPYSEALQGTAIVHPKYDDAQAIYGDIFKKIDSAMILINLAPDAPSPKADLLFSRLAGTTIPIGAADFANTKTLWLKFANTIKLRMIERMSEMTAKPAYFAPELAIVAGDPNGFLTVDASVNPGYLNTTGKLNPFFGSNFNSSGTYINDFWRANAYAISLFQTTSDPRLGRVYNSVSGNYVGNSLGLGGAVGSASSTFGPGVVQAFSQDAVIMLAAESYFIQAEAAVRGWITGNAQALYEAGVRESFRYLGVPNYATAAATYVSNGNALTTWSTATTNNAKISLIISQKYLAEDLINVLEPYCDYRRFLNNTSGIVIKAFTAAGGGGILTQSPSVDVRQIPYRLLYPSSEVTTNPGNIPGNIDHHTSKIFWMP